MPPQNPDQNTQSTMAPPESSPQASQAVEPDYGKLPPQLQAKLQKWHQNGQENQQLGGFQDVAKTLQMAVTALNIVAMHLSDSENQSKEAAQQYTDLLQKMQGALSNLDNIQQFDQVLGDMHQTLSILKDVERPQMPDYAQPVVEAVSRLESALTSSLDGIKTQPDVHVAAPEVPAPQVSVDVDLKRIEQILSKDIPQAFDKAIKAIPKTEIPENDQSALISKLDDMLEQLGSIDTATRMKPQPGSIAISNLTDAPIPVTQTASEQTEPMQMQQEAVANVTGRSLVVEGYATALLHIISSTAMSGGTTVNFEGSTDGTTWTAVTAQLLGSSTLATTTTSDGDYRINVTGLRWLRARISTYSAGKTTILGYVSPLSAPLTTMTLATGTNTIGAVTGNVASGVTDSGNPVKVGGKYNSSNVTLTDGQRGDLQLDVNAFTRVTLATLLTGEDQTNTLFAVTHKPVASSAYTGTAFSAVLNDVDIPVKGSAGNLLSIEVSSINAGIRYLQLHNKATAPAGGDTPVFSTPIPAGSATVPAIKTLGRDFFGEHGHYFSTGISVGISTAAATFTAATTTDHVTNGTYV